ncbi:MAG: apolipoprotein N-acyltransferase [Verrucomicrobia bacterium]|nr:apolipoprotein N-acyltransferase [Verrucomicrobiota bacterium]
MLRLLSAHAARERETPVIFSGQTLAALAFAWIAAQVTAHLFEGHDFLVGAFLAVTPFALGIVGAPRRREVLLFAFGGGSVFFMSAQYFLGFYSWSGLTVMALWQAATLAPLALGLRWLHGRWRWPLAFALPIVWVGGEYLRNIGPLSLPTGMLYAPCHRQLWMIQVCDLAGVYGLDFALAMVNGLLADAALAWWWWRRHSVSVQSSGWAANRPGNRSADLPSAVSQVFNLRRLRRIERHSGLPNSLPIANGRYSRLQICATRNLAAVAATAAIWLFIPAYGWYRLSEAASTMRPGPVLTIVQPDIPYRAGIADGFDPRLYLEQMLALNEKALTQSPPPALVVWPEAMSTMPPLNAELLSSLQSLPEELAAQRQAGQTTIAPLRQWVERNGVPLLLGSLAWLPSPTNSARWICYNSGMIVSPNGSHDESRQFKMRLFPGGEQIPGHGTFIHEWLRRIIDLTGQIRTRAEIEAGEQREVFRSGSGPARYIITICYEMLFSDSSGAFLSSGDGRKPFDFLVNISNDGIFQRSRGQLVHWRVAPFRAVESRIGIARAANTGIPGFIKPTGEIYGLVTNGRGQIWTGLGAPELSLMADVVKRREREGELLRSPREYQRLTNDIARIAALRAEAGVSGQSTQTIFTDTRRTLYSRTGDVFARMLMLVLMATAVASVAEALRKPRRRE